MLDPLTADDAVQVAYDDCLGVTYAEMHADPDAALDEIVRRYHQLGVADRP